MSQAIIGILLSAIVAAPLFGQRVPVTIDSTRRVFVTGHIPPGASQKADRGPVDPQLLIHYISLFFTKTPEQQADFENLLKAQRDPRSPEYVRWLTPAQYAARFGMDEVSLGRARAWVEKQGFSIDTQATSRNWIAFSGTAAQIDNAFHTELHVFEVGGRRHFAPTRDPSVPEALRPAILAIRGLDDFNGDRVRGPAGSSPAFALGNGQYALTPDDLAVIYDIAPLYAAGIDGSGMTIAVVGASSVNLDDLSAYQTKFGLPAKTPQLIAVADPGIPPYTDAESEASLDLELSGAIARGASQIYVYSDRFEDAATYAIDNAVAPVLSMSFSSCENNFTSSQSASWESLAQEAASKGMTWVVASGDSGPAGCDPHEDTGQVAQDGISVNLFAALPEVTGVGGTEFNEAATNSSGYLPYWNSVNSSLFASAGGYIPETAWDDTATAGYLAASGGGTSKFFPKPSWQVGALGVPNDGARDVPDIALAASWLHDGFFLCTGGVCGGGHGGTSAATPTFAGLVALLNQSLSKAGVLHTPGLGNINPMLYQFAQSTPNPFHDIVTGSNTVPCLAGSPDCATGSYGFPAGPNYDLVTGLGSIDATQLNDSWLASTNALLKPSCTTVSATAAGVSQTITVTVSGGQNCGGKGATTAPAGTVVLTVGASVLGSMSLTRNTGSSTAMLSVFSAQLPTAMSNVVALYTGNAEYAASEGSATLSNTTVAPSVKPSVQVFIAPDPVSETPTAYGSTWNFTLTLREVNGAPAKLVGFKVNTQDGSNAIGQWFSGSIDGYGAISVPLQLSMNAPATPQTYTLGALNAFGPGAGVAAPANPLPTVLLALMPPDGLTVEIDYTNGSSGALPVAAMFTAALLGRPNAASLQLTGAPSAVLQNPGASSNCQWSQQLLLRELAGTGVTIKTFKAGGMDMSAQIGALWSATRVGANSALSAAMCWSGLNAPILVSYEIDGTDDNGNTVSAGLTSPFLNPPASPNKLTVVPANSTPTNPVTTVNLNSSGGSAVFRISTTSMSEVWTASVFTSGISPTWLAVYPLSGVGQGNVVITPAAGLSAGTYSANLVFHSADAQPQIVSFPVTFTVQ
jgi:hypothetical protein